MSKKSFVLHIDSLQVVEELTDEQAGKLLKAIYNYQNGIDNELDLVTKVCFLPFRNQFIRDAVKYEETVERNKINGSKGGRPTIQDKPKETEENPNNPLGYLETKQNPTKPKKADNDSDSDNKKDNDSNKVKDNKKEEIKTYLAIANRDLVFLVNYIKNNNPQILEPYTECWNLFAEKYNKPKIITLSKTRRNKLILRLKNEDFKFVNILDKVKTQSFAMESNFFNFDWIIENDNNYLKILEGNYQDKHKKETRYQLNGKQ